VAGKSQGGQQPVTQAVADPVVGRVGVDQDRQRPQHHEQVHDGGHRLGTYGHGDRERRGHRHYGDGLHRGDGTLTASHDDDRRQHRDHEHRNRQAGQYAPEQQLKQHAQATRNPQDLMRSPNLDRRRCTLGDRRHERTGSRGARLGNPASRAGGASQWRARPLYGGGGASRSFDEVMDE